MSAGKRKRVERVRSYSEVDARRKRNPKGRSRGIAEEPEGAEEARDRQAAEKRKDTTGWKFRRKRSRFTLYRFEDS